jgi:hypothetical protein
MTITIDGTIAMIGRSMKKRDIRYSSPVVIAVVATDQISTSVLRLRSIRE